MWPDLTDLHSALQKVPILYNGRRPFPQKFPLPTGDLDPHVTRFLRPIGAHRPNGISIGSALFSTDDRRINSLTRTCMANIEMATKTAEVIARAISTE